MEKFIIADSGSTKTDWRIIDNISGKTVNKIVTGGVNPYFMAATDISKMLNAQWDSSVLPGDIQKIYFYGAGCSSDSKCEIVQEGLSNFFIHTEINVYHDLLAAARALFSREEGIAGILGTGSNSCLYRQEDIEEENFSLGYLFGDSGSGGHIGRKIITSFLKDEMPERLKIQFKEKYPLSKEEVLDNVYNKPSPNRFLAGFAEFAGQNVDAAFIQQIIKDSFREFFRNQITHYTNYKEYPLRIVGSIGFHFQDILKAVADEYDMNVDLIIQNPVEELLNFHLSGLD